MENNLVPTQAAREAAADYWLASRVGGEETQRRYRVGEADSSLLVQAFARLEQSAFAAGRKAGLAEGAEIARVAAGAEPPLLDKWHNGYDVGRHRALKNIADAIEERGNGE